MNTVKTAISIRKDLFEKAELLSRKLNVSRSSLFGTALEDFLQRYQNRELLEKINEAYSGDVDPVEQARLSGMRKPHRKIVEGEW
jgi:metal-responsive CopG/Arc/MetJ family transcriptional regulator